jgi:glucose/arabinose dehydrogenase
VTPRPRTLLALALALTAAIVLTTAVAAAKAPRAPLPRATGHHPVTVVARGIPTPTEFAVFDGKVFVSGYGNEQNPDVPGGVFLLQGGKAIKMRRSPHHVFGIAATKDTLYLSTSQALVAWTDWDGKRFKKARILKTPPFYGQFRAPAISPDDGKIYVGGVTWGYPPKPNSSSDLLAVDPKTGSADVIATGIRQPWMPLFVPGRKLPLLAILNQDDLGPNWPPDYIAAIDQGDNYGFPDCPKNRQTCSSYTHPWVILPPHSSPMGLAWLNNRIWMALYGGLGKSGPIVASMSKDGKDLKPFVSGFPAGVIALATVGKSLYAGDQSGAIYRVTP